VSISSRSWQPANRLNFFLVWRHAKTIKILDDRYDQNDDFNSCANSARFSNPLARRSSRSQAAPLLDDENDRIERPGRVRSKPCAPQHEFHVNFPTGGTPYPQS
jgi:hypothetical protein